MLRLVIVALFTCAFAAQAQLVNECEGILTEADVVRRLVTYEELLPIDEIEQAKIEPVEIDRPPRKAWHLLFRQPREAGYLITPPSSVPLVVKLNEAVIEVVDPAREKYALVYRNDEVIVNKLGDAWFWPQGRPRPRDARLKSFVARYARDLSSLIKKRELHPADIERARVWRGTAESREVEVLVVPPSVTNEFEIVMAFDVASARRIVPSERNARLVIDLEDGRRVLFAGKGERSGVIWSRAHRAAEMSAAALTPAARTFFKDHAAEVDHLFAGLSPADTDEFLGAEVLSLDAIGSTREITLVLKATPRRRLKVLATFDVGWAAFVPRESFRGVTFTSDDGTRYAIDPVEDSSFELATVHEDFEDLQRRLERVGRK